MLKCSCQQIAELQSQCCDGKVRVRQRIQIWVHTRLCRCPICKGIRTQLMSLRQCVRETVIDLDTRLAHIRLDEAARERLQRAMDREPKIDRSDI